MKRVLQVTCCLHSSPGHGYYLKEVDDLAIAKVGVTIDPVVIMSQGMTFEFSKLLDFCLMNRLHFQKLFSPTELRPLIR